VREDLVVVVAVLWPAMACRRESPPPAVPPVDEAAAATLGEELRAALVPCDAARVDALFDYDTLMWNALASGRDTPAPWAGITHATGPAAMGRNLCGTEQRPVTFHYLGVQPRDGQPWPLFRATTDDALDYIAFRPARGSDGRVLAVDTYSHRLGERGSATLREMAVAVDDRPEAEVSSVTAQMRLFQQALATGNRDAARRALAEMPASVRTTRFYMGRAAGLAESDDERLRAIDALVARFPGDPSLDLIRLEGYRLRKDHPGALAALDRIDPTVGGDPYLEALRADIHVERGDLDRALQSARSGVDRAPDDQTMWLTLAMVHIDRKDAAAAITAIEHLETHFGFAIDDEKASKDPAWAPLIASPEWQRRRAAR
jgi:hypothetical protein